MQIRFCLYGYMIVLVLQNKKCTSEQRIIVKKSTTFKPTCNFIRSVVECQLIFLLSLLTNKRKIFFKVPLLKNKNQNYQKHYVHQKTMYLFNKSPIKTLKSGEQWTAHM